VLVAPSLLGASQHRLVFVAKQSAGLDDVPAGAFDHNLPEVVARETHRIRQTHSPALQFSKG
jgi:hypothetical protein